MTNPALSLALFSALLVGCIPNEHGKLAATRTGDRIDVPAPRGGAGDPFASECGERTTRRGAPLARLPYVQSVTATSAVLVWTGSTPASVTVKSADGVALTTVEGRAQVTRYLREGRQYEARLEGLRPSSVHCYTIVDGDGVAHGPVGFRTAPVASDAASIDVLVFGDSGTGSTDQWALRQQMDTVPADLILHTGDLAYPSGTLAQLEEFVFEVYEDLFDSIPFFPAPGNDDHATGAAGPYREVFVLPENAGEQGRERWYSFDWGPVHFVALDTGSNGPEQAAWLDRDLQANALPWIIVYGHHPPYSSGAHGSDLTTRALYGPIFARHRVALVLSGHDHHYERMDPIDGVAYVVTGGGGASTRPVRAGARTVFAEDVLHFVHLRVQGDTLRGYAVDATGREIDAFRIVR